ncbi:MAG: TetR/AcrR family transcriptional regulator [Myxococcales bacterium]|nr:TetR/AcrR family transcriptional regulator [Myxococcales bacterium]
MTHHPKGAENPAAGETPRRLEKKARSQRRILEAAKEVFFRDGFMGANLDEVAEKAGVAKGTLYRYFDSKAELYVAILSHNGEIFEDKLRNALSPDLPPMERLRRASHFYFRHYVENPDYFQIFWAIENQSVIGELPESMVEQVTELWERNLRLLARIIEEGARDGAFLAYDPWETANILWTLANGIIQTERSAPRRRVRRRPLDRVFDDAIDLVLRGLANPDYESP